MTPHGAAQLPAAKKNATEAATTALAIARKPVRARGFTLVEVLVALGIVAIALAAGVRATASLTRNSERQSDQLLAHLCAENALINLRLAQQMPAVGDNTAVCEQAGRSLAVKLAVQPTPNPNFLRVEAQVSDGQARLLNLSTIVGRY
jgi:general secretion pathway protein I